MKVAVSSPRISFTLLVATLLLSGCGPKRVASPVVLTPERTAALSARADHRVGPSDIYPDLTITPGVAAPDVTQENIHTTICVPGFTKPPRRPPSQFTDPLKIEGFTQYGLSDHVKGHYEEDHLISLELGGAPRDAKNLWPEPYNPSIPEGGARFKDKVEKYLNRQICHEQMTLADAQKAIVEDWYQIYLTKVK